MGNKKTIIFDFDGTIVDTVPEIFRVASELAVEHGLEAFTRDDFDLLRGMSPPQIISHFHIPLYKIPLLVRSGQKKLKDSMHQVTYIPGIPEVLRELAEKGYILGILTSNSKENVEAFLSRHNLVPFHFIHAQKNLFGKEHALKRVCKKYSIQKEEAVYIGDEVRDVEACVKFGIDVISVTWGFNSRAVLSTYNPGHVVDAPSEIIPTIESL